MKIKLMPSERKYLAKVYHKHMNNDDVSVTKTDAWTADTSRSLKAEGSVDCLGFAALIDADYLPYHNAIINQRVGKDEGTMDVDAFKVEQAELTAKLKMLEAKVMIAMPDSYVPVIKNLDFDNIKVYNKGAQAEQILSLEVLKVKMTNFPLIVSLIPEANIIIAKVKSVYEEKELQFRNIKSDSSSVADLKSAVAEVNLKVFGKLTDHFSETPGRVKDFYNLELIRDDVRAEDFLYIDQYAFEGTQGTIMHLDTVAFDFDNWITAENQGPLAIDFYLTSVINGIISVIAHRTEPGATDTFAFNTIGASTQRNLMAAIADDITITEPCKFKITISTKK